MNVKFHWHPSESSEPQAVRCPGFVKKLKLSAWISGCEILQSLDRQDDSRLTMTGKWPHGSYFPSISYPVYLIVWHAMTPDTIFQNLSLLRPVYILDRK